tara:strand:+ start:2471 stop:2641 length:171 start_codon:yes stop_codon:yes gene_type:complete
MLISAKYKTNWYRVGLIVFLAGAGLYFIGQSLSKPAVQWQTYSDIRAAELKAALEE